MAANKAQQQLTGSQLAIQHKVVENESYCSSELSRRARDSNKSRDGDVFLLIKNMFGNIESITERSQMGKQSMKLDRKRKT